MNRAQAIEKVQTRYAGNGGKKAVDWVKLFDMLIKALATCGLMASKSFAKDHPFAFQALCLSTVRKGQPELKLGDKRHAASALAAEFTAASAKSLGEFIPA